MASKANRNIVENRENRYLKELRKIATIESIGSSTRIEGATLTDKEVQELLSDIKITKLKSRDEQEVIGYYEVLAERLRLNTCARFNISNSIELLC